MRCELRRDAGHSGDAAAGGSAVCEHSAAGPRPRRSVPLFVRLPRESAQAAHGRISGLG
jgi:hypothetical protein